MREIKHIIIHCSATPEGRDIDIKWIERSHIKRGFKRVGYHYVIKLDGTIEEGRGLNEVGAHVEGFNAHSIGICYVGGLDEKGRPKDTRTPAQKNVLRGLVQSLICQFPGVSLCGHRDLSPDRDGDGVIEKHEWMKACPSFDVLTGL